MFGTMITTTKVSKRSADFSAMKANSTLDLHNVRMYNNNGFHHD